jgi:predicted ATP-binding protein involved in virulence
LYISKIYLENIRAFKELTINLRSDSSLSQWALILGDNGVGKTTVLRSVAMGLCDGTGASALLKEIPGEMIRDGEDRATIRIELTTSSDSSDKHFIETILSRGASGDVEVKQTPSEGLPWQKIFVCAYGASRGVYGTEDQDSYSVVDSVYSLFNYKSTLQNPELVLRRLQQFHNITKEEILHWIDNILMLPAGSTKLARTITINGPWGSFKPSGALGDGYDATLALITDLIGWWGMLQEEEFNKELEGIVLIDELEQHLHPKWQQSIIKLLHDQFPKIQFLATTHSPLCAIGTSELTNEECELVLLEQTENSVIGRADLEPPRRLRADQVLTSYLFGLDSTRGPGVARDINRYSHLKGKRNRSQSERQELSELHSRLDKDLGSEETELQRLVETAVKRTLEKLPEELGLSNHDPEALDFEVRRQLKGLFDLTPANDKD